MWLTIPLLVLGIVFFSMFLISLANERIVIFGRHWRGSELLLASAALVSIHIANYIYQNP